MGKRLRYIFIFLLAALVVWLLFCTHCAGVFPVQEVLRRMALPAIVFLASSAIIAFCGFGGRAALFVILCVFTLFESVLGLLQLLDLLPSNNAYFTLTGSFENQGLYGCLMSLTSAACLQAFIRSRGKKAIRIAVAVMFAVAFVMMAVSVSRAAWLGFAVAAIVMILRETTFRIKFRRKISPIAVIAAGVLAIALVIVIKPQSALSRLHIWRIDCMTIFRHPLLGTGSGAEISAYGEAQQHFFAGRKRAAIVERTADSPQFVYNEFLKFGIQGGVPGLLLSIAVYALAVFLLLKKRSGYAYMLIAFGVFSLFSFPLNSVTLASMLAVLLADASVLDGRNRVFCSVAAVVLIAAAAPYASQRIGMYKARKEWNAEPSSRRHYGAYYPELRYEPYFISLYGYQLYASGHYREALAILEEGALFSSEADYYCTIGHCQEMLGDVEAAIGSYRKAMYMVPSRMMPYYSIITCYLRMGMKSQAQEYRERALSIPYNHRQKGTVKVRKMIEEISFDSPENQWTGQIESR